MTCMEENVFESHNRAVVYLDLLGFAALVEASPRHFMTAPSQIANSPTWPRNEAAERLAVFHRILDSRISAEQPNHAMVFSDCAFLVFYTTPACADFAAILMQDFLRACIPVRMGVGFGTFHSDGTTTSFAGNSTIVRSMFGGTSVVRAVNGESCGGKGMRIFAHSSFSEVYEQIRGEKRRRLEPLLAKFNSVSVEVNFVHELGTEEISQLTANIQQMASGAKPEFQHHYSETLGALSRMTGNDPGKSRPS
jgi:hypothetical protein